MSDTTTENQFPVQLTPVETALLELTNGSSTLQDAERTTAVLTTKRAYIWAAIIAEFLQARPGEGWSEFSDVVRDSFLEIREDLQTDEFDPAGPEAGDMKLFYGLTERLKLKANFSDLEDRARDAYRSLVKKRLVQDPFLVDMHSLIPAVAVGKMAMMVLANVPIGMTKTTKQGETVSKMNALFWEYECRRSPEETKRRFEFRLLQFLKFFAVDLPRVFSTIFPQQPADIDESVDLESKG